MASNRQLAELLGDVARTLVADFEVESVLGRLTERIVDLVPVAGAGVSLISSGTSPRPAAASSAWARHLEELQATLNEGPCLAAWGSDVSVSVADLRYDDQFPVFSSRALESGLSGVFTFPVGRGGHRLGALDLYRDVPGPLDGEAMAAGQTFADVVAAYLGSPHARSGSPPAPGPPLYDQLTGLATRTLLAERLEEACLQNARTGELSSVLFVTLIGFDSFTQAHGAPMADELMVAAAGRLAGMLAPGDLLSLLDHERFVLVCDGLRTPAHAADFAAQVESAMQNPFDVSGIMARIGAEAGIAFVDGRSSARDLLARGVTWDRHRVDRRPSSRTPPDHRDERHLEDNLVSLGHDLRGAVGRGELHVHYQPIVAASDGSMVGTEALVRWLHPVRGLVPPTTLIPLAEDSSLIVEIGAWVLEQALASGRSWQGLCRRGGLEMSVNVSAYQLRSPGFVATVAEALRTSGTDPHLLTLEVTGGASVGSAAIGILTDLKGLGVKLALDGFGTGTSSLSDIARFPVDVIQFGRAFVAGLGSNTATAAIVGAVIDLAHGLGMTVGAEGVETITQLQELAQLGCDTYQGFLFSPPLSVAKLDALADPPSMPHQGSLFAPTQWERLAGSTGFC